MGAKNMTATNITKKKRVTILRPLFLNVFLRLGYRTKSREHFDNVSVFSYFLLIINLSPYIAVKSNVTPSLQFFQFFLPKNRVDKELSTFHQTVYGTDKRFVEVEGFEPSSKLSAKTNSLKANQRSKLCKKRIQNKKAPNNWGEVYSLGF
jgi:hypothetical protein